MWGDDRLCMSLEVTLTKVFASVLMLLALALAVAVLLDKGMRDLPIYRSVFYLPSLLGGSVAVAIIWRRVFGKQGLVNSLLAVIGFDGPGWVAQPAYALGTLIVLNG